MSPARFAVACFLLALTSACNKWSDDRIRETKRRGEIIAPAIEAYHAKYAKYPTQLKDLQPEFLREIPRPTAGDGEWDYHTRDEREWSFAVVGSEWGPQLARTSEGDWWYIPNDQK